MQKFLQKVEVIFELFANNFPFFIVFWEKPLSLLFF